jgi:hypothetical protein
MPQEKVSLQTLIFLAQKLAPVEKLKLIQNLSEDLQSDVAKNVQPRRRSLRGVLKGCSISAQDIDDARKEMWGNFPREDI